MATSFSVDAIERARRETPGVRHGAQTPAPEVRATVNARQPFDAPDCESRVAVEPVTAGGELPASAQQTISEVSSRLSRSHPSASTSTLWPSVIARPAALSIRIMCTKNTIPGSARTLLPA